MKNITSKMLIVSELFSFIWRERLWWIWPIVITLILITSLIAVSHAAGPLSPFLYATF